MRKLIVAGLLLAATPAAALNNAGFETGNTAAWASNGTTGAATSYGGFSPVYGNYLGYVQAGQGANVYSTLTQTVALAAGQTVKGQVGFKANDYLPFNDDAYLSVNGTNIFSSNVAAVGNYGSTGWTPFSFTATTAGNYTFQLGVTNRLDNNLSSGAVIDGGAVPEPAVWGLMIVGFGMVGMASRRRIAGLAA